MNTNQYLVTIVVPTHNRSRYAISCVESLLDIKSADLQIVVHDTSNDECELQIWAETITDDRLTYVHYKERLSMTENHEQALRYVKGEYVCLIGDDDSVSERIIDIAKQAKESGYKIVTPEVKAFYYWPDFRTRMYGAAHAGKIYLDNFSGKTKIINSEQQLDIALHEACQGTDKLPKLYHGLVSNTLLDQLRSSHGRVFFGASPDMSASVALSLIVDDYVSIDFPFTIPGGAGGSNSGRSAAGKHKGDLRTDPHMTPFKDINWPSEIPEFFSVETIWAHAAIETLGNIQGHDHLKKFNLSRLYALCIFNHKDYMSEIKRAISTANNEKTKAITKSKIARELSNVIASFCYSRLKRVMKPSANNGKEVLGMAENIRNARQIYENKLAGRAEHERIRF